MFSINVCSTKRSLSLSLEFDFSTKVYILLLDSLPWKSDILTSLGESDFVKIYPEYLLLILLRSICEFNRSITHIFINDLPNNSSNVKPVRSINSLLTSVIILSYD